MSHRAPFAGSFITTSSPHEIPGLLANSNPPHLSTLTRATHCEGSFRRRQQRPRKKLCATGPSEYITWKYKACHTNHVPHYLVNLMCGSRWKLPWKRMEVSTLEASASQWKFPKWNQSGSPASTKLPCTSIYFHLLLPPTPNHSHSTS